MRRLAFHFATAAAVVCFLGSIRATITGLTTISLQNSTNAYSVSGTSVASLDIPVQSFSVSPELLQVIVPFDTANGLFLLPEKPSNTLLAKLMHSLRSNSNRVGAITYLVKKFTHYDPASVKLITGVVETFKTLSLLYKSMKHVELYSPLLVVMTEVIEAHINFIKIFTASLTIDRIAQIESFKKIIIDLNALEGMFYLLSNLVSEEIQGHLVNFIFSAVENEEEEKLVWSFYKRFASPSKFIALPHEFLCFQSKEIKKTISDDLIKILSKNDSEIKAAWLSQFGLLIRLRTISTTEALLMTEAFNMNIITTNILHFGNFIRLVFLDDLITEKLNENVLNFFNFRPETPENLREFYIFIWNSVVSNLPVPLEEVEFSTFLVFTIKDLEMKFPGISEQFDSKIFDELEELKSIQFIHKIDEFNFDISTSENFEKVIEFLEVVVVEAELEEISIKDVRFSLNFLYKKIVGIIEKLKTFTSTFDFVDLKLILSKKLHKFYNFIENFKETSEVELFIDFAFTLPEISDAEELFHFIYFKIDGNSELLSFFFQKFAQNLKNRPNFFFIRFDRDEFVKFDHFVIQNFLENIKTCPLSDYLFLFLTRTYLNGLLGQEQLFEFLENFKNRNFSKNLNFNGSEFLGFFASISEVSYFEFRQESQELLFDQVTENSKANAIKSLEILTSIDGDEFEFGLIPWLCNRIAAFEHLKPEITENDQLNHFSLNLNLSIEESARLCTQIISHILKFGVSQNDLQTIFEFIKNLRKKFDINLVSNEKRVLAVSSSFCLLVFIIRSNESLVPIEYALDTMNHYKLKSYRISVVQTIYKSYKNPNIRAELFPALVHFCFDRLDYGYVHDPYVFDGMLESTVTSLLKPFFKQTFHTEGVDRLRIESLCFWISSGLIPLQMAKDIVTKVGEPRERPISLKLAVALIRAVFKQEKYASLRTLTVELLFLNVDHCTIFPRPFMSGIIGGVADLVAEPEFLLALSKPSKYSEDLRAIFRSEYSRRTRINVDTLSIVDGIENVMENYSHALLEISSFSFSLERKNMLLRSIFSNLSRLTTSAGENDLIGETFTLNLLDDFVRISIQLACQIHTDSVGPVFVNDLDPVTIEIYFAAIIQFVRDSNVQSLLTFDILTAIKDRPESRESILDIIPRYINWRRFLLIPDSFRFIFNFNGPVGLFDKFMTETIDAAFRFVDLFQTDAVDNSRPDDQILLVHESFFSAMTCLIMNFNLPAKYTIQALQLMNKNYDSIEILSTALVQFLRAAIKTRQISPESSCYRITSKSFGPDCIYDSPKAVIKLVIDFLEKRPDFLCMALVNEQESEAFKFMVDFETVAKNFVSFKSTPITLIRSIFNWPHSGVESLKLLSQVFLPKYAVRSVVGWFSSSTSTSHEAVLPIAFIILDLIPSTFTIEAFTDANVSQSWLPISDSIIEWFTKLATDFPKQFGQMIEDRMIEKYFNILFWSLEYDKKENFVSDSLSIFLEALTFSSSEVKYRAVHLFSSIYFRPLLMALASSKSAFSVLSTNFRKLTDGNFELAKEVEKLIPFLYENESVGDDDAVLVERTRFLDNLNTLESVEEFSILRETLVEICRQISRLRSMGNENDLTLKFIEKLGKLAKKFYPQTPSEHTTLLAFSLCKTIKFLRKEILLQSNPKIFFDLFRFFYKHISTNVKSEDCFEVTELIFSQIVNPKDIQTFLSILKEDLRLGCCLLPTKGFSNQFYKDKAVMESFVLEYLVKMTKIGSQFGKSVELDGIHFISLFNILNRINASDDLIEFWIRNVSGLNGNDVLTEDFSESLKSFSALRKNFIEDLAKIYINEYFVKKMFDLEEGKCKENLFTFFKLVFMQNTQMFQKLVNENLPTELQQQMREKIGDVLIEKKKKVVLDFVIKCNLPADKNFELSQVFTLTTNLEPLLKFDLNLLPSERFTIFFRRLEVLINELPQRDVIEYSNQIINLLAISCALRLKYGLTVNTEAVLLILRLNDVFKSNAEVATLIIKHLVQLDYNFTQLDSISILQMIEKSSEPNQILRTFFNISKSEIYRIFMIGIILESKPKVHIFDIHFLVQDLLITLIQKYKHQTSKSLEQFEDLSALIHFARTHKLLGKTQLLVLDRLN